MTDSTSMTTSQRRFLRRVNVTCAWGEGVDGFDLGILSVTLPLIVIGLGMGPVESGLVAASSLIGIFFGAPLVGLLSDKFGRKRLFMIDLVLFVVLGGLQAVVDEPWQLFVVRLLLGACIGAEYALGGAMLAEFVPAHGRGKRIAAMIVCFYVGYLMAVVTGFALVEFAGLSWRWVLATSVLPAIVTLVLRIGLPESPRWLVNNGRAEQAKAVVDRYLGAAYFRDEAMGAESVNPGGLREILRGDNGKRLAFCCVLWACTVAPYFAIFTFAPTVLSALGIGNETAGTITVNAVAAIGAFLGMMTLEHYGRRRQVLVAFAVMAAALAVVALWGSAPGAVIVLCFAVFSLFNGAQGNLTVVYPSEILPTEVRATGIGIAAAASRLGAAVGTFLLPIGIDTIGIAACMLIAAAVTVVGWVVSYLLAPETTGKTLAECSRTALPESQQPTTVTPV